ncbi:threonine/serine exporter family protein [Afifella sp. H1R]|uniref:threonine/serine exporter family protein n=1 Tax=Afifella sp. H1R TaxID=2908841 RepID=UPI001F2C36BD|nr:threonine/serine exporter family protein [Afifella sp. H1R]MCF1504188.1 threonine/serine exporter family protein [Afifella sp. H1R]
MTDRNDPVVMRHRNLEKIAMTALAVGRTLVETGAKTDVVRQGMTMVAEGLGADQIHARIGFASLSLTVTSGDNTITRMRTVGAHGVNLRLNHGVRRLCTRVKHHDMTVASTIEALTHLVTKTPRHPWYLVALAVGLACASFGRLLGIDWSAFMPVLIGGALGQAVRHFLLKAHTNPFVVAAIVACVAATTAGFGSELLASPMLQTAMFSSVLLLVPGVPVLNAQTDIMEGYPTMGSARAMTVLMILVFITIGVWAAQMALGVGGPRAAPVVHGVLHQAFFGATAAFGFGILFNFGWRTLFWAALAGGLALSVRTVGLELGWSLAAASFMAAAAVGVAVRLLNLLPDRFGPAGNVLAVAGCIPMVPGSAASQGIMGLMELTAQAPVDAHATLLFTVEYTLRAIFTMGAIGAGLTIVTSVLRRPDFPAWSEKVGLGAR